MSADLTQYSEAQLRQMAAKCETDAERLLADNRRASDRLAGDKINQANACYSELTLNLHFTIKGLITYMKGKGVFYFAKSPDT